MKYMGSKSAMLKNGLGELLLEQCENANRFVDLFCGSASVSAFVGERRALPVISCDLQTYSYFLSQAIIGRIQSLSQSQIELGNNWILSGKKYLNSKLKDYQFSGTKNSVLINRSVSARSKFLLVRAYGGHYFSYSQIATLNYLLSILPVDQVLSKVLMASLLEAASNCAASPGHTAQPFQPKGNGLIAINEAWSKNPMEIIQSRFDTLQNKFAKVLGESYTMDSHLFLAKLNDGDLVFLDPPYSGVHYSRFYHVLESLARKKIGTVEGKGRYPLPQERPKSNYSLKGKSADALNELFRGVAAKGAKAIITFPKGECSNGLSGELVKTMAKKYFLVQNEVIKGRFSTLGGNNENRPARQESQELVLLMKPK